MGNIFGCVKGSKEDKGESNGFDNEVKPLIKSIEKQNADQLGPERDREVCKPHAEPQNLHHLISVHGPASESTSNEHDNTIDNQAVTTAATFTTTTTTTSTNEIKSSERKSKSVPENDLMKTEEQKTVSETSSNQYDNTIESKAETATTAKSKKVPEDYSYSMEERELVSEVSNIESQAVTTTDSTEMKKRLEKRKSKKVLVKDSETPIDEDSYADHGQNIIEKQILKEGEQKASSEPFSEDEDKSDIAKYIVGIDTGTANCGYAYGFLQVKSINLNRNWAASLGYTAYQAPTALLQYKDRKYFGFEAFDEFIKLQDEDDDSIKVDFKQNLYMDQSMLEGKGFTFEVMENISHYLQNHYYNQMKEETRIKDGEKIQVVKIIEDNYEQKKRQAKAKKLDIPQIKPIHIKASLANFFGCVHPWQRVNFETTTKKVLIISTGGSATLVSLYECTGKDTWYKLDKSKSKGSSCINNNFIQDLQQVFGDNFIQKLQTDYCPVWFSFMGSFEKIKRGATLSLTSSYTIPLEYGFGIAFQEVEGQKIDQYLTGINELGFSITKQGTFAITPEKIKGYFDETLRDINEKIELFKEKIDCKTDVIYVTGGMATCDFLQHTIHEMFPSCKVIVPEDANMCGAKGAVLYGQTHSYAIQTIAKCDIYVYQIIHQANNKAEKYCDETMKVSYLTSRNKFKDMVKMCSKGNEFSAKTVTFSAGSDNSDNEEDGFNILLYTQSSNVENSNDVEMNPIEMVSIDTATISTLRSSGKKKLKAKCYFGKNKDDFCLRIKFNDAEMQELQCILTDDLYDEHAIKFK